MAKSRPTKGSDEDIRKPLAASPMEEHKATVSEGLSEILAGIEACSKRVYRDSDGNVLTDVKIDLLTKWAAALMDFKADASNPDVMKKQIEEAYEKVNSLSEAHERFNAERTSLQKAVKEAEKRSKELEAENAELIAHHKVRLAEAKADLAEAQQSKVESAKALAEAERALKRPAGIYDPDEASELGAEIKALREDIIQADKIVAAAKAVVSSSSKELDVLHKAVAERKLDLTTARSKKAKLEAKVIGASKEIIDDFKHGDIDFTAIKVAFGSAGLAKLREVLDTEAADTKGRIARLVRFFDAWSSYGAARAKHYVGLVKHAYDIGITTSSTWSAVVGPWINGIIKDICTLKLRTASMYRHELNVRVAGVLPAPKADPIAKKVQTSNAAVAQAEKAGALPEARPTWSQVAKNHREKTESLLTRLNNKVKSMFSSMKTRAANMRKRVSGFFRRNLKPVYIAVSTAKQLIKGSWKLCCTVWDAARMQVVPDKVEIVVNDEYGDEEDKIILFDAEAEAETVD